MAHLRRAERWLQHEWMVATRRLIAWGRDRPFLMALVVMAIIWAPAYVSNQQQNDELRRLAQCAIEYAERQSAAADPRAAATAALRDAEDQFYDALRVVLAGDANASAVNRLRRAAEKRDRVGDELDREVARHPLPEPPSEFCPELEQYMDE